MTQHLHSVVTDGCYRCELGRDEALAAQMDELNEAATDALHNSFNGSNEWEDALARVFQVTLDGLSPERMSLTAAGPYAQSVFNLAQQYLYGEVDTRSP